MAQWRVNSPFGDHYLPGDIIEGPANFNKYCPFVDPEPVSDSDTKPKAKPKDETPAAQNESGVTDD